MLHFDMKPPFPYEVFLDKCRQFLSESDYKIITALPDVGAPLVGAQRAGTRPAPTIGNDTIKKWVIFDTQLRNEFVKVRSGREHVDPSKYLRPDGSAYGAIPHIVLAAHRSHSILEGERLLDRERWNYLNELEFGHYFDIDILIIYAYKLKILERWEGVRSSDKDALLERTLKNA